MSDLYETMKRTTLAFYNAGDGPFIRLGTDNPSAGEYMAGYSAHRELHALVLAGIPPIDALRAGTINGARALKMEGDIGSIAPRKWADMFVVDGDPLANIENTRNVVLMMLEGEMYDPSDLIDQARGRIGPANDAERADW